MDNQPKTEMNTQEITRDLIVNNRFDELFRDFTSNDPSWAQIQTSYNDFARKDLTGGIYPNEREARKREFTNPLILLNSQGKITYKNNASPVPVELPDSFFTPFAKRREVFDDRYDVLSRLVANNDERLPKALAYYLNEMFCLRYNSYWDDLKTRLTNAIKDNADGGLSEALEIFNLLALEMDAELDDANVR